jgi:hypothetical protein
VLLSDGSHGESLSVWLSLSCSVDAGSAAVQRYSNYAISIACVRQFLEVLF